jgi:hypothetical protein
LDHLGARGWVYWAPAAGWHGFLLAARRGTMASVVFNFS